MGESGIECCGAIGDGREGGLKQLSVVGQQLLDKVRRAEMQLPTLSLRLCSGSGRNDQVFEMPSVRNLLFARLYEG